MMIKGQIYLNCSLTDAFCVTIVEAASCGLHVISTKVGGVPEVLPENMMTLTEPNAESIIKTVGRIVEKIKNGCLRLDHWSNHERIKNMYYWPNVARRTEKVYREVTSSPRPSYQRCGPVFGFIFAMLATINHVLLFLCSIFSK
uniref:Glycosyl transferase family 1 domain-containing protein n=1 Tax=Romanomermis culicivorax TaxID=13658 RepID=A0A915IUF6_ROMCU